MQIAQEIGSEAKFQRDFLDELVCCWEMSLKFFIHPS